MNIAQEHPFADLLPELYAGDPVLLGLIAVFEQLYLQNERRIDGLPEELYNPRNTPDKFLDFLGGLVGLCNENNLFLPAQMRALIPVAHQIQRKKGTRQALQTLLAVYLESLCGHPVHPVIMEYEDWQNAQIPPHMVATYAELYRGENDFVVLFPPEPLLQSPDEQIRLQQLVKLYCPAFCTPHILVLGLKDGWGYLDVNTYL